MGAEKLLRVRASTGTFGWCAEVEFTYDVNTGVVSNLSIVTQEQDNDYLYIVTNNKILKLSNSGSCYYKDNSGWDDFKNGTWNVLKSSNLSILRSILRLFKRIYHKNEKA